MSARKPLPRKTVAIREDELRSAICKLTSIVAWETNTLSILDGNQRCARGEAAKNAADTAAEAIAQIAFGLMEANHAK